MPEHKLKLPFIERMQKLLPDKKDYEEFLNIIQNQPQNSIRCNTLKISPEELKKKLESKGWKISQPWKSHKEVMIIENDLAPGEIGRALEHLIGYYYVQELVSMLPILALNPQKDELVLDLASSPGSKTTQMASLMKNTGTIIANEISMGRLRILASNLERCGATNTIITRKDGVALCERMKKFKPEMQFDKILVDAPCSGEGTLRSSPKTYLMWNPKTIFNLSRLQKQMITTAFEILKPGGEMIYSTCTHAPEENEEVVDFLINEFKNKVQIEKISLPIKCRPGLTKWQDSKYSKEVNKSCRIYPQDNNTEGFFLCKIKKLK